MAPFLHVCCEKYDFSNKMLKGDVKVKTKRKGIAAVLFIFLLFIPGILFAEQRIIKYDNWYDLKSLNGSKIGYYNVKVFPSKHNGNQTYKLEGTFHITINSILSKYVFHSTDWVIIDDRGVLVYEINENDNGKVRITKASRKKDVMEIKIYNVKDGPDIDKKSIHTSDYDYTQFEMRFPISFSDFKLGKSKQSRILVPAKNIIIRSEIMAKEIMQVNWNGENKRVLVLESTSLENGKPVSKTTSWMLENGELLFTQDRNYSVHLTTKEKALSME